MKVSKKKPFKKASAKAQSAMEYLMTYGWAILIISVVLAALFQLGVFNPMTFAPKAPPGSCQVFRPNGPGTTSFINLEGICSGELPQYVAHFNGQSSIITTPVNLNTMSFTVALWVNGANTSKMISGNGYTLFNSIGTNNFEMWLNNGGGSGASAGTGDEEIGFSTNFYHGYGINGGSWNFLAVSVSNGMASFYANGAGPYNVAIINGPYSLTALTIAQSAVYISPFAGDIANIQIYNTSLSANDIQALYLEGIGGAPIDLQNLVAWWPLNGNANDYSGNGYNGQTTNVNFVSNWYSSYTPP